MSKPRSTRDNAAASRTPHAGQLVHVGPKSPFVIPDRLQPGRVRATYPHPFVRFTEKALEKVIREIALLAHVTGNNATTGPAFKALFPNGLEAELSPLGGAQVAAATSLRQRLDTHPAAATIKAKTLDNLDRALQSFSSAVDAREAADVKLRLARALEVATRERLVKAYDRNLGAIRQIFPRDREQQDLYFDEVVSSRSSSQDDGGEPPAPVMLTSNA